MGKFLRRVTQTIVLSAFVYAAMKAVGATDPEVRRDLVRHFNKYILNPVAIRVAAHRPMYYGVLQHIGRHSGTLYLTPVVAKVTDTGVLIPLLYGPETDWCKNVQASGDCTLTLKGQEHKLDSPEIVPSSMAEPLLRRVNAAVWRGMGIKQYLLMKPCSSDETRHGVKRLRRKCSGARNCQAHGPR